MAIPIIEDRTTTGKGAYCVGAVANFDPNTLLLDVGKGIFKLHNEMAHYEFPGCRIYIPSDTTEIWMIRNRMTHKAHIGVNVGFGVDNLTYELIERIIHLTPEGWCVVSWHPKLEMWGGNIPDPGLVVIGDPATAIVFSEYPAHLQRAIEVEQSRDQALLALRILKDKVWSDSEKEQALQSVVDILLLNADLEDLRGL